MRIDALVVSTIGNAPPSQAVWVNVPLAVVGDFSPDQPNSIQQNILLGGKTTSGEWVDVVIFENWLKWAIQRQVFNVMQRVAKPSPLQIENAINVALEAGKQLGGITRYRVRQTDFDVRNRTASFEWKAQLTNAIHSTTISGIVKP